MKKNDKKNKKIEPVKLKNKSINFNMILSITIVFLLSAVILPFCVTQTEKYQCFAIIDNLTIEKDTPLYEINKNLSEKNKEVTQLIEHQVVEMSNSMRIKTINTAPNTKITASRASQKQRSDKIEYNYDKFTVKHDVLNCNCNYTAEELELGLLKKIKGYAQYYIDAHEKYGICPLYNVAKDSLESGWGEHAPGNNLGGVNTSLTFSSPEEFINWWSNYQLINYLTEDGKYYNGTTIEDINKCYNGRKFWEDNVVIIMNKIDSRIEHYKQNY